MTKAQAMTVSSDLISAGYNALAVQQNDTTWKVDAWSRDGAVNVTTISSFATSHSVTGTTDRAEFV